MGNPTPLKDTNKDAVAPDGKVWARRGDLFHLLNLSIVLSFALCVAKFVPNAKDGNTVLFDPLWVREGFCVSNPDTPYWTSHDLCLYGDTILAVSFGLLYLWLRKTPGMEAANDIVKFNIIGIVAHGFGHGMIAKGFRDGVLDSDATLSILETTFRDASLIEIVRKEIPGLLFWVPLLKATMPNVPNLLILPVALVSDIGNLFLPRTFGFTYVQTVLMISFSVNQLARPIKEKGVEYALYPAIVGVPLAVIGWLESTTCSNFMISIGGHIVYDYYIPIAMIAFYLMSFMRISEKKKVKTV